jgi:capsular exopolysaccharide synthesis family protein
MQLWWKQPAPDAPAPAAEQLVSLHAPTSFEADQYRTLRLTVERHRANGGLQVIAVTSPCPAEGKSITALNLAGTLAQARTARVLIVDADLRRPSVARYLGLAPLATPGLAEALLQPTYELPQLVQYLKRFNLFVLPAGTPQSAPYELLNSARLEELLAEARRTFDYVVIDTSPLLPFPDARLLGRYIDGFFVTVAAHRTRREMLAEGLNLIDPAKVLGVVFNGDDQPRSAHYGYYHYDTQHGRDQRGW